MPELELTDTEKKSLEEIPHPSLPEGSSIYGGTKVFPDLQAENGETYFTLVHGIAHESSVSFVAILQATRALRQGFESAIYFYGPGSLTALAPKRVLPVFGLRPARPAEVSAFPVPEKRRGAVFDESMELLWRLLREESVDFEGEFFSVSGARVQPLRRRARSCSLP